MSVYTVHAPPPKDDEADPAPDRFAFVRDGFSFWAFLVPPLWMLRYRLWLVLLLYIVTLVALGLVLWLVGASPFGRSAASLLLSFLVGLEAGTLRRWTLGRRNWRSVGVVVADDLQSAERRFFDAWVKDQGSAVFTAPSGSAVPPSSIRLASEHGDVLGLFPEPGATR